MWWIGYAIFAVGFTLLAGVFFIIALCRYGDALHFLSIGLRQEARRGFWAAGALTATGFVSLYIVGHAMMRVLQLSV